MMYLKPDPSLASVKLLKLEGHDLIVWRIVNDGPICVAYKDCMLEDVGGFLGMFGEGCTFEEAAEDYLQKISGKTLVFEANTPLEKRVKVL